VECCLESTDVNRCEPFNKRRAVEISPENGTPWSRAKAQSCRDAAARAEIAPAVRLMIKTAVMPFVAALLLVALKNRVMMGYGVVNERN